MKLQRLLRATTLGLMASLVLFSASTRAELITFNLEESPATLLDSMSRTESGVTLTLDNFSESNFADFDGLCFLGLGSDFCPEINGLDMTFSEDVRLISYQVGFIGVQADGSTLEFTQGGNSSVETPFVDEEITDFMNQFDVLGNQILSVTGTAAGQSGSLQIRNITVERGDVPVPATLALLILGLAGLRMRRAA